MFSSMLKTSLGLGIILVSLYYSIWVRDGTQVIGTVLHVPSLLLVTGMLLGIAVMLVEFKDFGRFIHFLFGYSVSSQKQKLHASEQSFEQMLELYTAQGNEAFKAHVSSPEFPRVWQIVATKLEIRVPIHDIRNILKFQIRKTVSRLDQDITVLRQLAALAPSAGMFGSVLGLIRLLANMKDFSSLGSNMSLALITTLYGIFIANILLVPLIRRVENRKYLAMKNHENIMYWLASVEENKPSFYLKQRLQEMAHAHN